MQRTKPPYRADHVGSLIRPDALIRAREQAEQKAIPEAELKRIQQAAIRDVVRMQEELGLKLVTDGRRLFLITDDARRILDVLDRQFVFSIALGPLVRELRGRAERLLSASSPAPRESGAPTRRGRAA